MQNGLRMSETELAVKKLIIESLKLEDITPGEIDSDEPLFGSGLGLDSIDALELGVAIRRQYGIKFETVNDEVKAHFANVRSLARFIDSQRGG
ncbi:phosphopantetheine-binding protein [Hypericibacter sp.]|uniref:phosphopantetheine-binding protein n=1 Tax=Hypericibacter sp. TaxID=2705401 RepID=UPI003D6C9ACC